MIARLQPVADPGAAAASSRGADARFAAPVLARSVQVAGSGPAAARRRAELAAAGLLAEPPDADLVLAAPRAWRARPAGGPRAATVVLDPALDAVSVPRTALALVRARRELRRAGYTVRTLMAVPGESSARALAPLAERTSLDYLLRWVTHPPRGVRRVAAAGLRTRPGRSLLALSRRAVVVASRADGPPALLGAVPPTDRGTGAWVLLLSAGDELTRVVLLSLDASGRPVAAAKSARTPAARGSFDAEATVLGVAAGSGVPGVPRLLAREAVAGLPVSVEQAMPGQLLSRALETSTPRQAHATLDRAAAWAAQLALQTRRPPEDLGAERRRLAADLDAGWPGAPAGLVAALVAQLPAVPGVLAHNDLGTWNVLVAGDEVSAVDWESAASPGWPLWDLLYLLTDGLALVDGARGHDARAAHALALHRGELASSRSLFGRLRESATALDIGADAVGALATLCWLHHGLSRRDRAARGAGAGTAPLPAAARLGSAWLGDPRLGARWPAFHGAGR